MAYQLLMAYLKLKIDYFLFGYNHIYIWFGLFLMAYQLFMGYLKPQLD